MPILLILLGLGAGVGGAIAAQASGLVALPGAAVPPTAKPMRDGFLVFIQPKTSLNQIEGAFFDTMPEADAFAQEIAPQVAGRGTWRMTIKDNKIVQGSVVSFSVPLAGVPV